MKSLIAILLAGFGVFLSNNYILAETIEIPPGGYHIVYYEYNAQKTYNKRYKSPSKKALPTVTDNKPDIINNLVSRTFAFKMF